MRCTPATAATVGWIKWSFPKLRELTIRKAAFARSELAELGSLVTLCWRETDSNRWSLAERKKASSGSSTPRVRLGPQGDKRAKPCSLLREPEHNIPAASHSGIACRQALQDYRHFP